MSGKHQREHWLCRCMTGASQVTLGIDFVTKREGTENALRRCSPAQQVICYHSKLQAWGKSSSNMQQKWGAWKGTISQGVSSVKEQQQWCSGKKRNCIIQFYRPYVFCLLLQGDL